MNDTTEMRCGFVAVLGAPNAGKSTLVNALVGTKVSIVTQKVQTTRMNVRGIAIRDNAQLIFVDTPGIFAPKRRLDRAMVQAAWGGAADADAILLVVDAADVTAKPEGLSAGDTARIMAGLKEAGRKAALVLNKIDGMRRDQLLPLTQKLNAEGIFERVFMVSALKGEGVADIAEYCASKAPVGPWHYPEDQVADIPLRLMAAEITREKLYLRLHDELPYASAIITESWKEQKDGSVRIDQTILVERESQKAIVIGKGGQTIKIIGEAARHEMEEAFGHRVHLFLHTKLAERWGENREHYRDWGLEYPKDQ
jgi:GTP-binding protein Era